MSAVLQAHEDGRSLHQTYPKLNHTIQMLYHCALAHDFPQPFLAELCKNFDIRSCIAVIADFESLEMKAVWHFGSDDEAGDIINDHIYLHDPLVAKVMTSAAAKFYSTSIDIPEWKAIAPQIVLDWTARRGVEHAAAVRIPLADGLGMGLFLQRSDAQGGFEAIDIDALNLLVPHMQEAMFIHQQYSRAKQAAIEVPAIIDSLPIPSFMVNHCFDITLYNKQLEQWMQQSGLAQVQGNQFVLRDLEKNNELFYEVSKLVIDLNQSNLKTAQEKVMHWHVDEQNITFVMRPLIKHTENGEVVKGAICFLHHAHSSASLSRNALREIFHLSERESEICELMVEGYDTNSIGNMMHMSVHTVRDTMKKRIFKKCGCHSQNELIALLLSSPAAFLPR